ncbi:MAG TPA: ABC transporter permease, partial [Bacteroidia bacterium]|nr:ABC transporter permease [Bacteroidia bacterium]
SHPAHSWKWIPAIRFHSNNQFHRFLFGDDSGNRGVLRGDLGISYRTKQPVASLIASRIGWTLFFTLTSVILSFLISIPVALKSASKPGTRFDKNTSLLFTILYSLPAFWLATMLMMLFCNPDVLNVFPSSGVMPVAGFPPGSSLFDRIVTTLPYLILPTICYTYSSFAFVTRSIRANAVEVLKQDYIRTARAKGLKENNILRNHVFRNTLLPIITMFSNVFPYAISGSVILETVFTLPGMGLTIYQSVDAMDYPVILAVFTLTGIITIAGFLITDIVYAWADPRINQEK